MEEDFLDKSKMVEGSMNINLQKHPDVLNDTIKNATMSQNVDESKEVKLGEIANEQMYEDSINDDYFEVEEMKELKPLEGKASRLKASSFINRLAINKLLNQKTMIDRSVGNVQPEEVKYQRIRAMATPNIQNSQSRESVIQKAFGRHFEFSEKYLVSDIDGHRIIRSIKKRYKFKSVTKEILKHILYEGAKTNDILRINDECFENLAEVLNLPLDTDDSEYSNKLPDIHKRYVVPSESINIVNPNEEYMRQLNHNEKEGNSNSSSDLFSLDYNNNKFLEAKDILSEIITIERDNPELLQVGINRNKVNPVNDDLLENYRELKKKFKKKIEQLLFIRSNFNKNMIQDIFTTATTVQEEDDEEEKDKKEEMLIKNKIKNFDGFSLKSEIKRPYIRIFFIIIIFSLIGFACIGIGASQSSYSKFIGPYVIISKGCAGAVLSVSTFMMISVSYNLLSCVRAKCRKRCLAWLDHNIVIHRFCGYLVTIYGVIHSIFHLCGSIQKISETENAKVIQENFHHYEFTTHRTYAETLFGTMTGLTGFISLIVILLMAVTSLKCVRKRCFQVFGYTHMILFPIFFVCIMIHGLDFWLNWGVPFAVIFIGPGFILLIIQQVVRLTSSCKYKFHVADCSLSPDKKFIMILLELHSTQIQFY